MSKTALVLSFFLIPPFIGAAWHFGGTWIGVPLLLTLGVFWIGVVKQIAEL